MADVVSCGGVAIYKSRVLLLYKNQSGRYMGWVMPRGTHENGESYKQTALREVREETGVLAKVVKYLNKTSYCFRGNDGLINKTVHWYLMSADSFYCKPQAEEFFFDAGFYKQHEAYHLLKYYDEKQILKQAFFEYEELNKSNEWNNSNKFRFK